MATGNFVSTTIEASDELYDCCCSVCAENSITKEARTYCKDCAEYLCETCLKQHNRFPKMRSHVITDTSGHVSGLRTPVKGSNTYSPKCGVHLGNDLTVFCKQHDEFCCQSCIALKHRSCNSTIEISQAATNIKNSTEYQAKVTALYEVLTSLQEVKIKTQDNLTNCKSEKENVLENVNEYKKQLHALVDEISQKTNDWINVKYEGIETTFRKNISTLETVITSTEQALQNVTSENEVRSFVYMRSCTDVVDGCHELLQEIAQHTDRKPLRFSLNTDITNTFVEHETLLTEVIDSAMQRTLRIPEAIFLADVDPSKIKFMKASKANEEAIEAQLQKCNTAIVWPQQQENVMLQCIITSETQNCYKLVKTWREEAQRNFGEFMKLIVVHKVPILQEIWQKVMDELKTVTIEKPDTVALLVDESDGIVTIVGNKPVSDSLAKRVNDIAKKVLEEAEKERQKVKEVVTNLKLIETRMLLADRFPTKMESLYPDLKVKINQGKNEILFEGMLGDVQGAKLKMYELKNNFAVATVDSMPGCKSGLYHLKQTKDYIVKKLKRKGVVAVWEMNDNNLTVASVSKEQLKVSVFVLSESVVENNLPIKPASRSVLKSEQWQIKVEELHATNTGKCLITVNDRDSKIDVCATDDIANEVFDSVKNYLRQHNIG